MRMEELHERTFGNLAAIIKLIHDVMMHERGSAFVHDFRLFLRVEILRDVAHDADDFTLPGAQDRRRLLDKIEKVFFRQLDVLARRVKELEKKLEG